MSPLLKLSWKAHWWKRSETPSSNYMDHLSPYAFFVQLQWLFLCWFFWFLLGEARHFPTKVGITVHQVTGSSADLQPSVAWEVRSANVGSKVGKASLASLFLSGLSVAQWIVVAKLRVWGTRNVWSLKVLKLSMKFHANRLGRSNSSDLDAFCEAGFLSMWRLGYSFFAKLRAINEFGPG